MSLVLLFHLEYHHRPMIPTMNHGSKKNKRKMREKKIREKERKEKEKEEEKTTFKNLSTIEQ